MKKIFSFLSLSFFIFSINFTYARTLSKKEYRYLLGTYLLGKGNKKRLIKLLNKTDNINKKLLELENKQKNLEKDIKTLKQQIDELSNKLDKVINLLKVIPKANISVKSEANSKISSQKLEKTSKKFVQKTSKKNKKENIENIENILTAPPLIENKSNFSNNSGIKENKLEESKSMFKHNFEENENTKKTKEKQYTISDLINDIENAIYYKGKGDTKSYEKLIKEMEKKYPEYRSKLEKCLKDPDYIFQLYIEVLNLESK